MDEVLNIIKDAATAASEAIGKLIEKSNSQTKLEDDKSTKLLGKEANSLLGLKNSVMTEYLAHLALIITARVDNDIDLFDEMSLKAVSDRVVLERGVRPLEKDLSYAFDRAISSYKKYEQKQLLKEQEKNETSDSSADSDSEDEKLLYKPEVGTRSSKNTSERQDKSQRQRGNSSSKSELYKPPRISATPYPGGNNNLESNSSGSGSNARRRRHNSALEEYIAENSDRPLSAPSIGTDFTVMNAGDTGKGKHKGAVVGTATSRERAKAREVRDYEENNFTRLPIASKKQQAAERKRKARVGADDFFGEEWGLSKSYNGKDSFSGKRKQKDSLYRRSQKRSREL